MATATSEAIWKVADELDAEGVKPTLNAVRKKLGGGSFTTISDAMTEWKAAKQKKAQPAVEPLPAELSTAVAALAGEFWTVARTAAERLLAGERERLAAEQTALCEQAAEAVELADTLTVEAEGLREELTKAQGAIAERDKLARDLHDLKQHTAQEIHRAAEKAAQKDSECIEARKSERAALDRAARAEGEAKALREQLTQLTTALREGRAGPAGGKRG
ncbi:MAG: DNA-binding protein (plasmid) [Burkholderia sp.]